MKVQTEHFYEFGSFRLDLHERVLLRDGHPVPLTPKAFDTLLVLVENGGHIVEKDELMQKVWPDTFVEEMNLARHVSTLRKVLGDRSDDHLYIETVAKRGYRFVASVREVQDGGADLIVEEHTRSSISIEEEEERYDLSEIPSSSAHIASPEPIHIAESSGLLASVTTKAMPSTKPRTGARWVIAAVVALIVSAAVFWLYRSLTRPILPFQTIKIAKLTNTGIVKDAVISPDGKYVAYSVDGAGQRAILVRQVATSSDIQIVQPSQDWVGGLTFSPDGNYVYYGRNDGKNPAGFYQVPVLGGPSKKLMDVVSSPVTFAPDGKRFAFVRRYPSKGETALIIANADGTGEQKIAARKDPDFFDVNPSKPAWSPDGKSIACPAGTATEAGNIVNVIELRVEDGTERTISSHSWRWVRGLAWLTDGSGLVMTALEYQEVMLGSTRNFQIWHLSYPGGEARKITNDSNEYSGISITADSNTIVTTLYDDLGNIWTAPDGDASRARQITTGASKYFGVSWTPDGRIVYGSIASGDPDIWIADGDGGNQKQVTTGARANANPSVSPDGQYVVFVSTRAGSHIWRMDLDGRNPKQLTVGTGEQFPQCSPDSKWIVYYSSSPNKPTLWKVPIDGGEPVQLTDEFSVLPAISPDGRLVAYLYRDERIIPARGIAVIPFEGGQAIRRFEISSTAYPMTRWTPDGRALAYIDTRRSVSNIWGQPIDGGPPKQLTEFKADRMFSFDWSRDGKQLTFVRAVVSNDAVLISSIR